MQPTISQIFFHPKKHTVRISKWMKKNLCKLSCDLRLLQDTYPNKTTATHHKKDSTTLNLGLNVHTKTLVKNNNPTQVLHPSDFEISIFLGVPLVGVVEISGVSKLRFCWIHLPERSYQGPIKKPTKSWTPRHLRKKIRVFRTRTNGVEFLSNLTGRRSKTKKKTA